jgi:hypothetical protein
MRSVPESALADPQQIIADLQRRLAEREAERDAYKAERDEALEQQTATAEVLQVINSSPGDLPPVFDAVVEKAMRLCEAKLGLLLTYEGGSYRMVSLHGAPPAFVEFASRGPITPGPATGLARLARELQVVHIEDLAAGEAYRQREPLRPLAH